MTKAVRLSLCNAKIESFIKSLKEAICLSGLWMPM